MPLKILMPALSPTMTEGTLAKWLVKEGDVVKPGKVIAEIETDKATMEVESVDAGKVAKILVGGGTPGVKVNALIAVLLEEGEDPKSVEAFVNQNISSNAAPVASAAPAPQPKTVAAAAAPVSTPIPVTPAQTGVSSSQGSDLRRNDDKRDRIFASPLAKRLAKEKGVDLSRVQGSGPHGRIVKADLDKAPSVGGGQRNIDVTGDAPYKMVPHTTMRTVIAKRLTESKQTVPHFYLTVDMEIDKLLDVRGQINGALGETAKVSVNDMIIKAVGLALQKVPAANASWTDAGVMQYSRADVSVAVAIPGGLITPIVKGADVKSLVQISNEAKQLVDKARTGKLAPHEFQGGTFSISNLGMFGIKDFAAIINPPQGCILAVGAGDRRPVVKGNSIEIATVMSCTLSVDHRVVDGAVGAEFMKELKHIIEHPAVMLL